MDGFKTLNHFFDHIYVLTLQRAGARQEAIKRNLEGLNFEFFWGADKLDHPIHHMISEGVYDESLVIKNNPYHKAPSVGQICCSWSHKRIYHDVITHGYKKVLILEDDVTAVNKLTNVAALILNELPPNWELLYFDYSKNEQRDLPKQYCYHIQKLFGGLNWSHTTIAHLYPKKISAHISTAGYHDYTHAYAITDIAAKKLFQLQTPIQFLADDLLASACTNQHVKGFIAKPKMFTRLSRGSDKLIQSFVND